MALNNYDEAMKAYGDAGVVKVPMNWFNTVLADANIRVPCVGKYRPLGPNVAEWPSGSPGSRCLMLLERRFRRKDYPATCECTA